MSAFTHIYDEDLEIWRRFEIPDQPAWVLINGDGTSQVIVGQLGFDGITEAVETLIDG